jgi:mannitol-1-/sugar-/sorbitol-6-phosphatase
MEATGWAAAARPRPAPSPEDTSHAVPGMASGNCRTVYPMDLTDVQAVLLDMDGTLVDSDAAVERAWRTWADEYGTDVERVLAIAHGSPAERTVRHLRPDLSDEQVTVAAARQLALQYEDLSDVTAAPGARELLAELDRRRLPWAVVTSADAKLARLRLAAAGLLVPVLITVEDVRVGKPDPEGYLLAARTLAAEPGRCLVVEDAEPGVLAGQAAGATVAALKGVPADLAIDDLYQLTRLFTR